MDSACATGFGELKEPLFFTDSSALPVPRERLNPLVHAVIKTPRRTLAALHP
jgi:hypothetical protein